MNAVDLALNDWRAATGDLDWGTQRVMRDTILLVGQGKIHLAWGRDYGYVNDHTVPCLVNAVAQMLTADESGVEPSTWFPRVVAAFDRVNSVMYQQGHNLDYEVSGLVADILLANFGPLKPCPTEDEYAKAALEARKADEAVRPYVEPSDAEWADMLAAMDNVPPTHDPMTGERLHYS